MVDCDGESREQTWQFFLTLGWGETKAPLLRSGKGEELGQLKEEPGDPAVLYPPQG